MKFVTEGDLQLTIPFGATCERFDGDSHGLTHCMKAVDFVVAFGGRTIFMEFKDPEAPGARPEAKNRFHLELHSGELDRKLVIKYRDTFLYRWASVGVKAPIDYYVLIASSSLGSAELLHRTERLRHQVPAGLPIPVRWKSPIAATCAVMNSEAWNRRLPKFSVKRLSA